MGTASEPGAVHAPASAAAGATVLPSGPPTAVNGGGGLPAAAFLNSQEIAAVTRRVVARATMPKTTQAYVQRLEVQLRYGVAQQIARFQIVHLEKALAWIQVLTNPI